MTTSEEVNLKQYLKMALSKMDNKIELDGFIDQVNIEAGENESISYSWWPENYLILRVGDKVIAKFFDMGPEDSYRAALKCLKRSIITLLKKENR